MKPVLLAFFLLLVLNLLHAQPTIQRTQLLTKNIVQFEKMEWQIDLQAQFDNPFDQQQVKLDVQLVSPSGKPLLLPCYFDVVTRTWKARFTPQEAGKYDYYFQLINAKNEIHTDTAHFTALKGKGKGFLHKNDHWTFRFDNGDLFRGIGENVAWESRDFENDKWTYDYLLPTLAHNGANFFRTWMCYWNLPLEWQKVRNTKRYQHSDEYFNPGAIKRMDELVALCDSLDLYFMLTFDWHGHLMEHGGWRNSRYNAANGGPVKTPAEFFTSKAAQEMYKNKLRYIVARWGYATNIAVWEFFNEVDNAAFTQQDSIIIPLPTIAQWHLEMSRYLKDIDPYQHLVSTSISHRDIIGMNSIPYIDFNQKHIYKHTEKIPAIYPDYIQTFGKPYVVGEFGFRWEDQDPKYAVEAVFDYKRGLWYGLFAQTPILPMSWWWELFDDQQMAPYFKGVRIISDKMLAAGKGQFEQLPVSAGNIETYAVQCGSHVFVYCLNNTRTEQHSALTIPISNTYTLQQFNPNTQTFTNKTFDVNKSGEVNVAGFSLPPLTETIFIFSKK
ncbi:uncharacterized protein DUF5060 [Chitinophaga skermanii]|uniref:Uncharacterized protein DUF5060 n=1 Tax=Chitinophaga skermanii TaxID=331697 RepID=A0A327QFG9_9BACT|nr:DUF5060 domain-containing protein [Chitinophaga skermanii]RAJ02362.1 uncharacterized protein DUF5060 [Chitinophaga skermanii]